MRSIRKRNIWLIGGLLMLGCSQPLVEDTGAIAPAVDEEETATPEQVSAKDLLNDPAALAFCYGGFRGKTREVSPSVEQIKEDMQILSRMGVKLVRTYNTQQFDHAENLLQAIKELKQEQPGFEMYVMLGAWIECAGAWSQDINHEAENEAGNQAEIDAAIRLTQSYPDIVKIIAVGNEAMVHWASQYFVRPAVILKWVNHLQKLRSEGELPEGLWVTSSDNFAAWGGLTADYHTEDLNRLIKAVDYVSLHTYPFHHTHYDADLWGVPANEETLDQAVQVQRAMDRALKIAQDQYQATREYVQSVAVDRELHIGETGWASEDHLAYGPQGSLAADEVKAAQFYHAIRDWTQKNNIACFYFEAFDEQWKDPSDTRGSENHFGLFTLDGQAKYALWKKADEGVFAGLKRDEQPVGKTYQGKLNELQKLTTGVPILSLVDRRKLEYPESSRSLGEAVLPPTYIILPQSPEESEGEEYGQPSAALKANVWEGTCAMVVTKTDLLRIDSGVGDWWGCALEFSEGGENMTGYSEGKLVFEIRGEMTDPFEVGIQSGSFGAGTQVNAFVPFAAGSSRTLTSDWTQQAITIAQLSQLAGDKQPLDLANITSVLAVRGNNGTVSGNIEIRNIRWVKE